MRGGLDRSNHAPLLTALLLAVLLLAPQARTVAGSDLRTGPKPQARNVSDGVLITQALDFFLTRKKEGLAGERIPHILHHIFLDGEEEYSKAVAEGEKPGAKKTFKRKWRASCVEQHKGWEVKFWDREAATRFLRTHHPWFLATWLAYPMTVLQGDALRPFLMYTYGGLYLDLDVECFAPSDDTLVGPGLLLQSEYPEGEDVVNSVMASVPQHPFWKVVVRSILQKSVLPERADIGWKNVLDATGPLLYGEAFRHWSGLSSSVGDHKVHGGRVAVKKLGTWFIPCQWFDGECHKRVDAELALGRVPPRLVGYHRYTATWRPLVKDR